MNSVQTVRFAYRASAIRIIPDFLPSPAELAFRDEGIKVTLALSKKSVDFFKAASRHHTQYQPLIRRLLDAYVERQDEQLHGGPLAHVGLVNAARCSAHLSDHRTKQGCSIWRGCLCSRRTDFL
ncbi:MAG: hypothetical protein MRJ92_01510 [Nitrospira sp.]|nr:hypothetical protein [Nitrospira sp.]